MSNAFQLPCLSIDGSRSGDMIRITEMMPTQRGTVASVLIEENGILSSIHINPFGAREMARRLTEIADKHAPRIHDPAPEPKPDRFASFGREIAALVARGEVHDTDVVAAFRRLAADALGLSSEPNQDF